MAPTTPLKVTAAVTAITRYRAGNTTSAIAKNVIIELAECALGKLSEDTPTG